MTEKEIQNRLDELDEIIDNACIEYGQLSRDLNELRLYKATPDIIYCELEKRYERVKSHHRDCDCHLCFSYNSLWEHFNSLYDEEDFIGEYCLEDYDDDEYYDDDE